MSAPDNRVQAFLAAGHVCSGDGMDGIRAARRAIPRADRRHGLRAGRHSRRRARWPCRSSRKGGHEVENQYVRSVRREGTPAARERVEDVFELVDRKWRGIGEIPMSGFRLREEFATFDAERKFALGDLHVSEPAECHAGDVLTGKLKPPQCPAFGTRCTPEHPAGRADGLQRGRLRRVLSPGEVPRAGDVAAVGRPLTMAPGRLACPRLRRSRRSIACSSAMARAAR